jgi:hypothetical protein
MLSRFLSYIAALGAHRESIQDQAVLKLLDQALDDIQGYPTYG